MTDPGATEAEGRRAARAAASAWASLTGDDYRLDPMPRATNPLWRITSDTRPPLVLKQLPRYPPGADPVTAARVLAHLGGAGVTVAAPLLTDAGTILTVVDDRSWQLLPSLRHRGQGDHPVDAGSAPVVGAAIGRLDRALAGYPWPVPSFVDDPTAVLGDALASMPDETTRVVDPLAERLHHAGTGLPTQLLHGDCNDGNVLLGPDGDVGFIDIDHLPVGPRVGDLAYHLASLLRRHLGHPDGRQQSTAAWREAVERHVDGFHTSHPITARERAAVIPLVLLTALNGAHWSLHGWTPDPLGYRRNLDSLRWLASRYDELTRG